MDHDMKTHKYLIYRNKILPAERISDSENIYGSWPDEVQRILQKLWTDFLFFRLGTHTTRRSRFIVMRFSFLFAKRVLFFWINYSIFSVIPKTVTSKSNSKNYIIYWETCFCPEVDQSVAFFYFYFFIIIIPSAPKLLSFRMKEEAVLAI